MLSLHHNELLRHTEHEAFYSHVLTLKLPNAVEQVVLKDLQRHPAKPVIQHADFLRVVADQELRMHVPLHFVGEAAAPGVRLQKGIVTHHTNEVEIECLPANLPEFIEVDISALEIGDAIRLSGLKLPEGVALVDLFGLEDMDEDEREAADQPVVSIQPPAVEEAEAAPVAEVPVAVPTVGESEPESESGDE